MDKLTKKLLLLGAFIYALQALEGIPGASLFFYFKEVLHLTESQQQYIGGIITFIWWIKIFIGFITDNYLTKKQWIIISVFGSLFGCIICGLIPFSLPIIVALLLLSNLNTATRDVAIDGLSCVVGKETKTCDLFQKYQWRAIVICGILTSLCGGYIAEHWNYKIGFLVLIPFYIGLLIYLNTIKDKFENNNVKINKLWINIKEIITNKRFLLACLFLFLFKYSPDFSMQLDYIKRDVFGWSRFFMTGILPAISGVIALLGIRFFGKYYKLLNIKKWLTIAIWLGAITTLGYMYFTPASCIVYTILYSSISMFVHLVVMTWMAESSIKGKESMSYALLASVSNFSVSISVLSGGFLYDLLCKTLSKQNSLNIMIIIAALASFLCLPLIPLIFKKEN